MNHERYTATKKEKFAWMFYDWANSVYSLVITTAIFPIYFGSVLANESNINIFGLNFQDKDVLYSYSITVSFTIVVLLSPLLSALADKLGNKKRFLVIYSTLGSIGCASLFFFTNANTLWIGILGSIMASVGYWGSLVFYNAYLPEMAEPKEQDELSAKGFIYGYLGSAILLIVCLLGIMLLDESLTRYSFLLVAVWWIGFAQYTFKHLPKSYTKPKHTVSKNLWLSANKELIKTGRSLLSKERLKYFLIAFFALSVGIQTINYMATRFGDEELGLDSSKLIITILLIQFVAVGGSYLFSKLSAKLGNIKALQIGMIVWTLICVTAFFLHKNLPGVEYYFYGMGAFVGLVLGGVQAISRSTYAKMLPVSDDNTIFFSFYDVVEKIALILGSFIFAEVLRVTGSMQYSALFLGLFFIAALIFLSFIKTKKLQSTEV